MPSFAIYSDLHLNEWEAAPELTIPSDAEAVLLAGDIASNGRHIDFIEDLCRKTGLPIVYVTGNHEPRGIGFDFLEGIQEDAKVRWEEDGLDIHHLTGGHVDIGGIRIIGDTLWSDGGGRPSSDWLGRPPLSDLEHVGKGGPFPTYEAIGAEFLASKRRLKASLDAAADMPVVMMTHYPALVAVAGPTSGPAENPRAIFNATNAAEELARPNILAWISGHSHHSCDRDEVVNGNPIRFVSNQFGRPKDGPTGFRDDFVLEVPLPEIELELCA